MLTEAMFDKSLRCIFAEQKPCLKCISVSLSGECIVVPVVAPVFRDNAVVAAPELLSNKADEP